MATNTRKDSAKRKRISVSKGVAHIKATFNNTIVSITDEGGNVVSWSSAGALGYKGAKKSTPFVAQLVATKAAESAKLCGVATIDVEVKGPGAGRESAVRALEAAGLSILTIKDVTPVPHNGCRPPKRPRG